LQLIQIRQTFRKRIEIATEFRLSLWQKSQPSSIAIGVNRSSALSALNDNRYSAREVNIRYGSLTPARCEIIDHYTDIGIGSAEQARFAALHLQSRVQAGNQSLGGSFLITGCSIDLASKKQPRDPACLQRVTQFPGIDVIVLDCVAGLYNPNILQTWNGPKERILDVLGERSRNPVRIDRRTSRPSGSRKIWWPSRSPKRTILSSIEGQ
jgi:hypothetical protein